MSNSEDYLATKPTSGDSTRSGHLEATSAQNNHVKLSITTTTTPLIDHLQQANELSIISQPIVISGQSGEHPNNLAAGIDSSYLSSSSTTSSSVAQSELMIPTAAHSNNGTNSSVAFSGIFSGHQNNRSTPVPTPASTSTGTGNGQWMVQVAAQTTQGMRQRMSLASDQLGHSLRQLYASASSITDVPPSYHNIPGIVPYYHGRVSGPPPSYDDVINPYAPPPTYQSLFGQMREARKTSRGFIDLLRRLLIILISTLGCTILIAFMILIPFTMIIVGAIYIDECRVEHIPAFLLVGGLVWASKNIIHCYGQCQPELDPLEAFNRAINSAENGQEEAGGSGNGDTSSQSTGGGDNNIRVPQDRRTRRQCRRFKTSICESLLNCVLFGWFVAGCVIVFRNYEPDFENPASLRYCHRTVYMYTFWLITSAIIIFSLFIGCICCLMVSSAIASRQDEELD